MSEPSSGEWKLTREHRLALAAGALLCALLAAITWLTRDRNLALHAVARASSQTHDTTPAGAVDGKRIDWLGFHSDSEDSPWFLVDLGQPSALSRVEVWGRPDCCFDASVPLVLELSEDGRSFQEVARRTKPFSAVDPWIARLPKPRTARYVRLHMTRVSVLVFEEIEVYGSRLKHP